MKENIAELKELFIKVRDRIDPIPTERKGNTGIGKTFEEACGIVENNFAAADFKGIEIKSHRDYSGSYITLFTKSPTSPRGINTILRKTYGTPDAEFPEIKVLHTSLFTTHYNTHKGGYNFKLEIDYENEAIKLLVQDKFSQEIVDDRAKWSFQAIENIIEKKLKYIAYITAKVEKKEDKEYFRYTDMIILTGLTFEKFIKLLKEGVIMFDIRIGAYKTGKNKGKNHDHGSGFRISKKQLSRAFQIEEV
ncbi:MAG: MvaI/BcnI family restriction endonuclease [Candidatus Delongbacteria bacterium]|jgi:hypothetical protein